MPWTSEWLHRVSGFVFPDPTAHPASTMRDIAIAVSEKKLAIFQ